MNAADESEAPTPPTILVLDDEKNIRKSIEIALEQEGMHVLSAHDAAAAVRMLHERIVDLLILDIRLGDVDGLAFFKRMQAEGFSPPVIVISGNATLTEAAQAVKLGAFDFLEKPFSAERITVAVRRCLEFSRIKERLRLIEARLHQQEIETFRFDRKDWEVARRAEAGLREHQRRVRISSYVPDAIGLFRVH